MEIKNEQNLTDLLNDFIDRMTIGIMSYHLLY